MNRRHIIVIIGLGLSLLLLGFWSQVKVMGQEVKRENIKSLLSRFERGNDDGFEELLEREDEALPALLAQTRNREASASVRVKALDLLTRIDLSDDGVLNRDELLQAMVQAIDGSESNVEVVNETLWSLDWMDPRKVTPQMTQALIFQLKQGHERAIRVLGRLEDPALIPVLEPYASEKGRVGDLARQALAKLGDEHYLAGILAELDTEGPRRSEAFEKLAYIGDESTIRVIAQFLYHPGTPASRSLDVGYVPYRHTAAWTLGQIIENPPVKKDLGHLSEQDIELWQAWWEAHQHEYP
jgi:HEAT repeat protein